MKSEVGEAFVGPYLTKNFKNRKKKTLSWIISHFLSRAFFFPVERMGLKYLLCEKSDKSYEYASCC